MYLVSTTSLAYHGGAVFSVLLVDSTLRTLMSTHSEYALLCHQLHSLQHDAYASVEVCS